MQKGEESESANAWLYEKSCNVCKQAVGHGKFRPKKLKCRVCRRAVCPNCSIDQSEGTVCRKCSGEDAGSEEPRETSKDVKGQGRSSDLAAEDVLASAKEILADIKAKHSDLIVAKATERRTEIVSTSNSIIEKYQAQITAYDTEIQDMKKQIDWYAEQLDKREQTIQDMSGKITGLSTNNLSLEDRINTLEGLLTRLNEARTEERLPETKSGVCVKCQVF